MIVSIILLMALGFLGVSSGASWSWSDSWQKGWKRQLPEAAAAFILGGLSLTVYQKLGLVSPIWQPITFFLATAVSYAGIQSATWSFLRWNPGAWEHPEGRTYTLKPIVDWIAKRFNTSLGERKYSWISATVKGTIITLPLGGLGGFLFAAGYEIGSHFSGRTQAILREGLSFIGVGIYFLIILTIT